MNAYLILEDGTIFEGKSFGAQGDITGELVFTTGMTGYLETLTDQSYYGQIVLQTFPLIGNYGVIPEDFESSTIGPRGYIVKYPCQNPSNFRSSGTLDALLKERGIVGICDIDTRALTKIIRKKGVMNGKITASTPTAIDMAEARSYSISGAVAAVSSKALVKSGNGSRRVALMDFGAKSGIVEALESRECVVWSFPHDSSAEDILNCKPDGIMLSNGPGDPADPANEGIVAVIQKLLASGVPVFGICLGHQLLALAKGYKTQKLKFGHRGGNQPVKEVATGRVFISSQNHGYAVISENSAYTNVNDNTCEGLEFDNAFSVQFHPEANAGPRDTAFLFDKFIERMDANAS